MKFTGAAKVLGGDMMGLMRPKLLNLGIAGAGAIVAGNSSRSMNDRGMTVGNTLGAAAGTAAMVVGGRRAGIHRLATAEGSGALAKRLKLMGRNYGTAGGNKSVTKGLMGASRGLNKYSGGLAKKAAANGSSRAAAFDGRVSAMNARKAQAAGQERVGLSTNGLSKEQAARRASANAGLKTRRTADEYIKRGTSPTSNDFFDSIEKEGAARSVSETNAAKVQQIMARSAQAKAAAAASTAATMNAAGTLQHNMATGGRMTPAQRQSAPLSQLLNHFQRGML